MIVLDTHALLWWIEGAGLSKHVRAAIQARTRRDR